MGVLIWVITVLSSENPPRVAEIKSLPEYRLKALYLYNIAKFIDWPKNAFADSNSPLLIGILGKDLFGRDLDRMVKDRTANGRRMTIKRVNAAEEVKACHILFVSAAEEKHWPEVQRAIQGLSILTVGETVQFTAAGGVISMIPEGKKVGIELNVEAAEQARLVVSSDLRRVVKATPLRSTPKSK